MGVLRWCKYAVIYYYKRKLNEIKTLKDLGFEVIDDAGEGSFGTVKYAKSPKYPQKVAIKIIDIRLMALHFSFDLMKSEINIITKVNHRHIVHVHEVIKKNNQMFIVMEAAKGSLHKIIVDEGRLPMDKAKLLFSQIISAIDYLHENDIVHRDLKCENILLSVDDDIKVADFGLSRSTKGFPEMCKTICGTPYTMAPEVLEYKKYDAKKSDVWSLGVILYNMVTGQCPYKVNSDNEIVNDLENKPVKFKKYMKVEESCRSLINYMLTYNPLTRPSVKEVAMHPWLASIPIDIESKTDQFLSKVLESDLSTPKETRCDKSASEESRCDTSTPEDTKCDTPIHEETRCDTPTPEEIRCDVPNPEETTCDTPTHEETRCDTPTHDETRRDTPTHEETKCDTPTYEKTMCDTPTHEETRCDTPTHEETMCDTPTPEEIRCDVPNPEETSDTPTHEETTCDTPTPKETRCDIPTPEETKCDTPTPEETKCDTPTPEETRCDTPTPEETRSDIPTPEDDTTKLEDAGTCDITPDLRDISCGVTDASTSPTVEAVELVGPVNVPPKKNPLKRAACAVAKCCRFLKKKMKKCFRRRKLNLPRDPVDP